MDREDKRGLHTCAALAGYKTGQPVRVLGGPLDNVEGRFYELSDDARVTVLLTLLGKKISVQLDASRIAAA
tara:strand:- start:533 stop:745 length:213 start_codon:yes stop_codon:yes gene_type:complete